MLRGIYSAVKNADWAALDVLIAGTGSDLNVYAENCADGCCATEAPSDGGGCCSSKKNVLADLASLDLNQWVGK